MGDGKRVSKDHPAIVFLGDLDELNSHLGLALAAGGKEWAEELTSIQQDIFNIGGEASMSDTDIALLDDSCISRLESAIEEMNGKLPPLKEFILPGGDEFCARLHVTRTVCRRAERSAVGLSLKESNVVPYLNRLSDFLWSAARWQEGESVTTKSISVSE